MNGSDVQSPRLNTRQMLAAALCGLATFLAAAAMLLRSPQLEGMGGLVDEWYYLGINILNHGTLGIGDEPTVLRPPGYPLFIAVALRLLGGFTFIGDYESVTAGEEAVYWAQALCLAAAATILCVWLQRFLRPLYAFLAALAFGVNPYSMLLVGLLRYDVLLWMAICACGLAAQLWLDKTSAGWGGSAVLGVIIGLATVVRPIFLLFVPLLLLVRMVRTAPFKKALRPVTGALLGLALVIVPYTYRNHRVTGRIIPVNAQGWVALWGSTVVPLEATPDRYRWIKLAPHFLRVYARMTGETVYRLEVWARQCVALEDAFRQEALRNLRLRPKIYFGNCVRSLWTLGTEINTIQIAAFEAIRRGDRVMQYQFHEGHPKVITHTEKSQTFRAFALALNVVAALGFTAAILRRDSRLLAPIALWCSLWLAHGMTYMDLLYYSVKAPFLFVFAYYLIDVLDTMRRPRRIERLLSASTRMLAIGIPVACLLLSVWIFL